MSTRKSILEKAREQNELARLTLDTATTKRKAAVLAKYDATKPSVKRRQPQIETTSEEGIYRMYDRLKGCNIGRDLERNYSPARGIIHQFRANVVGSLGKIQLNIEGGDEAAAWFNQEWAKDCDMRDDVHFSTQLQNVVAAAIREGDLLAVVDDNLIEDSGKLIHWEADQIISLDDSELKKTAYAGATQENGIIRDKMGRIQAYIVTGKHGVQSISKKDEATFWTRQNARLVKNPWRVNQGRGVPALITSSTNFLDMYEMLSKEIQTAKRAAGQYAFVKRENAIVDWDNPSGSAEFLPENTDKTAATVATEGAGGAAGNPKNYERLESFTGGMTDYLEAQDKVEFPNIDRPNVHMNEFIQAVHCYAGASLGLARAYSLMRADSSYTSFRGDMILSWASAFYPTQKWLERSYADWVAIKVIRWAMRKKIINALADGWERKMSWQWPTMPHVDEAREEAAIQNAIKNGTTDYSKLLGPGWRSMFDSLSEQLEYGREKKLPLSAFEQKSGGAATSETNNDAEDKGDKAQ